MPESISLTTAKSENNHLLMCDLSSLRRTCASVVAVEEEEARTLRNQRLA